MTENRVVMDPSVLSRLAESMRVISEAWQRDVETLHEANGQNESLIRALNAATDRADNLNADKLVLERENRILISRNAHLEAQYQALHDKTIDARDALDVLAERAARRAAESPVVQRPLEPARDLPAETASPPAQAKNEPVPAPPPEPEVRPPSASAPSAVRPVVRIDGTTAERSSAPSPPRPETTALRGRGPTLDDIRRDQLAEDEHERAFARTPIPVNAYT